jgi:anti-sigma-K factor RskA
VSGATPAERFHLPTDPAGREALAGEHVLGTLDAETTARVTAAVQGDAAWRAAVQAWERRLAPVSLLARPETPPPDMWDRIAALITPYRVYVPRGPKLTWLWLGWAIVATLAAAGLAAFILVPILGPATPPPRRLMASLINAGDRASPSWLVDIDNKGELRLMPVRALTGPRAIAPAGRVLQFWALVPGGSAPIDLGLLPSPPAVVTIPSKTVQPVDDMVLEISLEAEGGSKIGRPNGPVQFIGRLSAIAPAN